MSWTCDECGYTADEKWQGECPSSYAPGRADCMGTPKRTTPAEWATAEAKQLLAKFHRDCICEQEFDLTARALEVAFEEGYQDGFVDGLEDTEYKKTS